MGQVVIDVRGHFVTAPARRVFRLVVIEVVTLRDDLDDRQRLLEENAARELATLHELLGEDRGAPVREYDHRLRPLFVRANERDAGTRTFIPRLDDERQVQRSREQRKRAAAEIEGVPRGRRQAFGGEQLLCQVLVDCERAGAQAAPRIRKAHPFQDALDRTVLAPRSVQSVEDGFGIDDADGLHEFRVEIERARFGAETFESGYDALTGGDRYVALGTLAAHHDRDPLFHRNTPTK